MEHIFSAGNKERVSSTLKTRLILFLIISIALLALIVDDVMTGQATWWMALTAIVAGLIVGFFYGRYARVQWHESDEKVVMRYDTMGFIIIGGYIVFSFLRDWLLSDILTGAALETISLAIIAGLLFGRFFGLHIAILRKLQQGRARS